MNKPGGIPCAALLVALLISGCAATLPQPQPFARDRANRLNERGVEAAERGDLAAAASDFDEAYRHYSAVEHFPGMVTALINSARVNTARGDITAAGKSLREANALAAFTPSLRGEVAFEQAKLLLKLGKTREALEPGERALAGADGAARSRMINLLAEIRLRLGEPEQADRLANSALATGDGNRGERANSLRLLAECALRRGQNETAASRFNEALVIDKELALSARISVDLRGLANAAEQAGQREKAMDFWKRAVDVSLAGEDRSNAVAAMERLALLREQAGDAAAAARIRAGIAEIMKNTGGAATSR